jgi:hypothetical protein
MPYYGAQIECVIGSLTEMHTRPVNLTISFNEGEITGKHELTLHVFKSAPRDIILG